jgi:predicted HNH restriction endonuclease
MAEISAARIGASVAEKIPSDLVALCRQCHSEIHWRQPANDNQIQFSFDFPEEPEEA